MCKRIYILLLVFMTANSTNGQDYPKLTEVELQRKHSVFKHAVIAHRGSTFWAPEETESAYRWARNIGADYLEVDIQRTKDGVLIALHDDNLLRTTNIGTVYSNMSEENFIASNFTYEELLQLDAGTWFNNENEERARKEFSNAAKPVKIESTAYNFISLEKGQEASLAPKEKLKKYKSKEVYIGGQQFISSLEDLIMISKGWIAARDKTGKRIYDIEKSKDGELNYIFYYVKDPKDNGHRPGIYVETKEASQYPGIEKDLHLLLSKFGYLDLKSNGEKPYKNKLVNVGNSDAALVLQTFSVRSLALLEKYFKNIPRTFLLWEGDPNMPDSSDSTYVSNIEYAFKNGASFIGPSISGEPNNYVDLLKPRHSALIRKSNLGIHGYSFDTEEQLNRYFVKYFEKGAEPLTDAFFANRSELVINLLISLNLYPFKRDKVDAEKVLEELKF